MPQISIVSGIYKSGADYRVSYPRNYYPVVMETGISRAYLRQTPGLTEFVDTPGPDRGAIEFQNELYRVCGSRFIRVSPNGVVTDLGYIPGTGRVSIARSFDRVCIVTSGQGFYYTKEAGLVEITDPNFALAIDVVWIDGYFVFTDGDFIFPAELSDPTTFDPLKYGSAEIDADAIVALQVVRNELHALGSRTIEVYQNVGGVGFPFQRVSGGVITKGCVGRYACVEMEDGLFFVGSGTGEAPGVYLGGGGQSRRVSTDEIDKVLETYSPAQLATIGVDTYSANGQYFATINLPDQTLVFDLWGSATAGRPLWHYRGGDGIAWRCASPVRVYGRWIGGDPLEGRLCEIRDDTATEYGVVVEREFSTPLGFVENQPMLVYELAITGAPAAPGLGDAPQISMAKSIDGVNFGQERWSSLGQRGRFGYIPTWRKIGHADQYMSFRFRTASDTFYSPARLDGRFEVLRA